MLKEMGSDFWGEGPVRRDQVYLLSGRTALEYIIRDIKKNYSVGSVLLPSYCCHTMIEPFYRHGIRVRFYDVYFDEVHGLSIDVPEILENEIFYYMTYFGFQELFVNDICKIKKQSTVFIEDMTHSWLCGEKKGIADYSYASYRKWTGFDAIAIACKKDGAFAELPQMQNLEYMSMRKRASLLKQSYMDSGDGEKQVFLELFAEAEELLEKDYVGYKPSAETMAAFLQLDTTYIADRRKENANFLLENLKDIPEIQLMFPTVNENEVPLFFPILVRENRTEFRKYLINHSIYCPIHWPRSTYHKGISKRADKLYQHELSLICDQRYSLDDMERLVEYIKKYYKR